MSEFAPPDWRPSAELLAQTHAAAFLTPGWGRPWSQRDFAEMMSDKTVSWRFLCNESRLLGFSSIRLILDESELLTICRDPDAYARGVGNRLLSDVIDVCAAKGANRLFLEVSSANAPALALYDRFGFQPAGVRHRYYRLGDGTAFNALILEKSLGSSQ